MMKIGRKTRAIVGVLAFVCAAASASAEETIKVGILHSLSGTMAISETSLKDVALMTIEQISGFAITDVLASRLQGQDVGRSAFFDVVRRELGYPDVAAGARIDPALVRRLV